MQCERERGLLIAFLVPTLVWIRNLVFLFFISISIEIAFKTLLLFNTLKCEYWVLRWRPAPAYLWSCVRCPGRVPRWPVCRASRHLRLRPESPGGSRCTEAPGSLREMLVLNDSRRLWCASWMRSWICFRPEMGKEIALKGNFKVILDIQEVF